MTSDENNSICACEEHLRAECRTEGFITSAEGKRYCLWHYPGTDKPKPVNSDDEFICEGFHSACKAEPFFMSHEGKDYCVLHYPGTDKIERFRDALSKKLNKEDYDFKGVWFPEYVYFGDESFSVAANFSGATFNAQAGFSDVSFGAEADFSGASFISGEADFSGTSFRGKANFSYTTFRTGVNFYKANFSADAYFGLASFSEAAYFSFASFGAAADFDKASFSANADFSGAIFKASARFNGASFNADANFSAASFNAITDFGDASFKDYVHFSGSRGRKALGQEHPLTFQFAKIEKPERVSFHTLIQRPSWFINVDPRKFEFVDVDWNYVLKQELLSASEKWWDNASQRLLSITFRQLADNAETNHRYYEASRFRYHAFEARRIEKFRGFVPWRLDWWYWLASGYGESVGRAALVFVALLALFMFGYKSKYSEFVPAASTATPSATVMVQGAQPAAPELAAKRLGWREAALYSFNVSLLQKPEPKPKGLWSSFLVALQTVLGPAQAALLALAVRRRFMR